MAFYPNLNSLPWRPHITSTDSPPTLHPPHLPIIYYTREKEQVRRCLRVCQGKAGRPSPIRLGGKDEVVEDEWKEGNVLFNDVLNTFYLRLYGKELFR